MTGGTIRGGFALVELVVVTLLTALLAGLVTGATVSVRRGLERVAAAGSAVEAARIARVLFERVVPEGRVRAAARPDEVQVLLPIGWAVPCDSVWSWSGIRTPDPARDVVEVTDGEGRVRRAALAESRPATCGGTAGAGRTFAPDTVIGDAALIRVLEPGVIRIDDAVRYARRGTPRQPITAPSLDPVTSGVELRDGRVEVIVAVEDLRFRRRW